MSTAADPSSFSALFSRDHIATSLMLAGGISLYAVETYVTATIMPSVVRDIGGLPLFAWVTTLYVTASVLGSVFIAIRPRGMTLNRTYMIGALLLLIGSFVCAVAPSMELVLVGRAVQGFGAGTLATLGYAFIRYAFPETLWTKASSLYAAIWGVSTFVGPTLGGFFAHDSAWRYAFALIIPLALIMMLLAPKLLPEGADDRTETKAAVTQMLLLTVSLLMVSFAGTSEDVLLRLALVIGAVAAIAVMVAVEKRATVRLLPRGGVTLSNPLCRIYLAMFMMLAALTSDIYIPYFLQMLHSVTPLVSGYIVALIALGWTAGTFFSSNFKAEVVRRTIITGTLLEAAGLGLLALTLAADNRAGAIAPIAISSVLIFFAGVGVGLCWAHLVTYVLRIAPSDEKDKATSGITAIQSLGSAFGAAMAGVTVNSTGLLHPGGTQGNISAATWLFALFAVPGLIAAAAAISLPRPAASAGD
ncbi:TPA: MFS transporter [Pseudomonas aeruginosa]